LNNLKNKRNVSGFTVIESLVAVFVLTVGFIAVTQLFPFNLRTEKSAEMKAKAIELAQGKVEEMSSKSYSEITCSLAAVPCEETESPLAEDNDFRRTLSVSYVSPQDNFQAPVPSNTDTGVKKISVTVFWKAFTGGEESLTVSTLNAQK
jgi:Tfp pilus assembly protein PilV